MSKKVRTYLETFYPGALFSTSSLKEVKDRDISEIEPQKNVTGFKFFNIAEIEIDGKILKGETENESGMIYFGRRYSAEQLIEMYQYDSKQKQLLINIRESDVTSFCKCDNGTFQPLYDGDMTYEEAIQKIEDENLETEARVMFDKLRAHIGEEVTYDAWHYGKSVHETGKLIDVYDFHSIVLEGNSYSSPLFFGWGFAIGKIISKDGEVLYAKSHFNQSYDPDLEEKLDECIKLQFGSRIASMKKTEREKAYKDFAEEVNKNNEVSFSRKRKDTSSRTNN